MEHLILRCWDKKSKKMRDVDSIAFHNENGACDYNSSHLPKVVNCWGYNILTQQGVVCYREIKDVDLMLCSGLRDKNGKLIFQGDILKFKFGNRYENGQVEYSKTVWNVTNAQIVNRELVGGALICLHKDSEVVGNIYENFDLLISEDKHANKKRK